MLSGGHPSIVGRGSRSCNLVLTKLSRPANLSSMIAAHRRVSPPRYVHAPWPLIVGVAGSGTPDRRLAALYIFGDMTIQRMDNVAIVVDDLDAAVAFFTELGMEMEGKGQIEGLWADRTVGLDGVRSDIAMMRTPDGHSKLELTKYHTPAASGAEPENPPPNTLGLHRVMFAVDDIDDTIARLRAHGAELLGEVAQYESIFRLCYLRGPAGIIVALAEQIG
jgi:catechol 2,3-dioxygenase-like lactoylglutathione lyase family enzyme